LSAQLKQLNEGSKMVLRKIDNNIKIGDQVVYTARFLRSIGDFSRNGATKTGKVVKLEKLGNKPMAVINGDFMHDTEILYQ